MFGVTVPTLNVDTSPVAVTRHGLNFVFRRRGPVTSGAVHACAFGHLDAGSSVPQYEILFAPFGVASGTENPEEATEFDHDVHDMRLSAVAAVTVYPSLLHPRSRGSVSLRSADPFEPPVIRHQLLGDEVDVAALAAACRKVREIFGATALSRYVAHEMVPGPAVQTDTELERFLRAAAFGGFHPIATCRMGGDDRSVVDPELRVRGVEGLRVVDASVMPTLISGHTNAPTVMLAEKAADLIKAARYAPPAAVRPATSGS
jgi:choline dehydrogenase